MAQWTHPMCRQCWDRQYPGRDPSRMAVGELERCAWCGRDTVSGIYMRADPATLPYPRDDTDD